MKEKRPTIRAPCFPFARRVYPGDSAGGAGQDEGRALVFCGIPHRRRRRGILQIETQWHVLSCTSRACVCPGRARARMRVDVSTAPAKEGRLAALLGARPCALCNPTRAIGPPPQHGLGASFRVGNAERVHASRDLFRRALLDRCVTPGFRLSMNSGLRNEGMRFLVWRRRAAGVNRGRPGGTLKAGG